jgi:hypothetical protein
MCVLYDMGYQLPNVHYAYLNAMDLCATALGATPIDFDMEGCDWDLASWPRNSILTDLDQCSWNLCTASESTSVGEAPLLSSRLDDGGGGGLRVKLKPHQTTGTQSQILVMIT